MLLKNAIRGRKWIIPSFIPILGLQTVASNATVQTEYGQSALITAFLSTNTRSEWVRTTPSNAGIYLRQFVNQSSSGQSRCKARYLINIESNNSSTPARGLVANTGGMETIKEALINLNALSPLPFDLPFPLSFLIFFDFLDRVALCGSERVACFRFLVLV